MMIGEVMFEAFHLPGHTAGNATYLVNKVMIMGDTAMAQDDDEVGESPAFFSASPEAEREQISNLGVGSKTGRQMWNGCSSLIQAPWKVWRVWKITHVGLMGIEDVGRKINAVRTALGETNNVGNVSELELQSLDTFCEGAAN